MNTNIGQIFEANTDKSIQGIVNFIPDVQPFEYLVTRALKERRFSEKQLSEQQQLLDNFNLVCDNGENNNLFLGGDYERFEYSKEKIINLIASNHLTSETILTFPDKPYTLKDSLLKLQEIIDSNNLFSAFKYRAFEEFFQSINDF